jgi:hypothetical protein
MKADPAHSAQVIAFRVRPREPFVEMIGSGLMSCPTKPCPNWREGLLQTPPPPGRARQGPAAGAFLARLTPWLRVNVSQNGIVADAVQHFGRCA